MADRFLAYILKPEPQPNQYESGCEIWYSITQARDGTLRVAGYRGPSDWEHMPTTRAVDLRDANRIAHEHWQPRWEALLAERQAEFAYEDEGPGPGPDPLPDMGF